MTPDLQDFENSGGAEFLGLWWSPQLVFVLFLRGCRFFLLFESLDRSLWQYRTTQINFSAEFIAVEVNRFLWVFFLLGFLLGLRIKFILRLWKFPSLKSVFESLNLTRLSYCFLVLQCSWFFFCFLRLVERNRFFEWIVLC